MKKISRRDLLKAGVASMGTMLYGCGSSSEPTKPSPLTPSPVSPNPDIKRNKALVYIMLEGGNDSFNMLVPTSNKAYQEYQKTRSNLALDQKSLLALDGFVDANNKTFGLHPSMPELQQLFQEKRLSFVANIAPMIAPTTKSAMESGQAQLPLGLLSHADQVNHWQTANAKQRIREGWFGRMADDIAKPNIIPMNISLSGNNLLQTGRQSALYSISQKGSVGLAVKTTKNALNTEIVDNFNHIIKHNYDNDPFKQAYLSILNQANNQYEVYQQASKSIIVPTTFSKTSFSQQLKQVARAIKAADDLNTPQQTFFIRYGGWDHHDELLNIQAKMLAVLSKGLYEFQNAIDNMGLNKQVITLTGSDFGRTLTSNGNGTDHGWGGNTIIMGSPIDGGKIFGQYPDLSLGKANPLDSGDGVIIPTTAIEQLYAELSLWFGISSNEIHQLFPNLKNFATSNNPNALIGCLKESVTI